VTLRLRLVGAALALAAGGASVAVGAGGCKRASAIEKLRDALVEGSDAAIAEATAGVPTCEPPLAKPPAEGCLPESATAFGSKTGFQLAAPDQAAAAAVALMLARTRRGDWVPSADTWRTAMAAGAGAGADALRLSVARAMASRADVVGRAVDDDDAARALLRAVAESLPGACPTYAALGDGGDADKLPPEMSPDHDPCVHRDLGRKGGPGPRYGTGLWRAVHAAAAAWREELATLHTGAAHATGPARARLEEHLGKLDAAASRTKLREAPPRVNEALEHLMGAAHAGPLTAGSSGDAGATSAPAKDAGPRAHP